ncbi:F-box/LRR-repeat protein 6-like [Saccoglossus kowalevskii]|uniref:F-box/LRR-repeat protein 6-like n=1 Tax=Saccoglossus kowalevskii TaxID=10224 RepID=A0ABM0MN73_SACKO|nr:PREDICTED: F-box/LRR-repeat protein 6-like [Saccoglossus kowalevskii]
MSKKRGIFGVAGPRVLYFFDGRDSWSSDDDSDSDFEVTPGEAEKLDIKIHKKRIKKCKERINGVAEKDVYGKSKLKKMNKEWTSSVSTKKGHGSRICLQNLPPEVLVHIFKFVVKDDNVLPTLCRFSKMCQNFYVAASHPSLWKKVDLSFGWIKSSLDTLKWLVKHRLTQVEELNLGSWDQLKDEGIQIVTESCPTLTSLILFRCKKLTYRSLTLIADNCTKLSALDLSFASGNVLNPPTLRYFIEKRGANLESLTLSGNKLGSFQKTLSSLKDHCPNLRSLDISGCSFFENQNNMTFPIEDLQIAWPKLQILRLNCIECRVPPTTLERQAMSPGFPELEELSLASRVNLQAYNSYGANDEFLSRLLKTSHKLKYLDIRNCRRLSKNALENIPAGNLQHLFMSRCTISEHGGLCRTIEKWQHSLVQLDISWIRDPSMEMEQAMTELAKHGDQSTLSIIDLSGSPVEMNSVRLLLQGCPSLNRVDLSSCRSISRGFKRLYEGKELDELRDNIS